MSDKRDAPGRAADLSGWPIRIGAGRALRPARSGSGQPPANEFHDAARLFAVGIEEAGAVEMIRHRAIVIARHGASAYERERPGGGDSAQGGNDPAARSGHPQSRSREDP